MLLPKKIAFLPVFSALLLGSCTEVIDLALENTSPQLVIEGNVTDQPGPYYVRLSQTIDFDQPNNWPAVSGARIQISESGGITDTLQEIEPGCYATSHLQGTPGKTYTLRVELDGLRHTASATMPFPVPLDTVYLQKSAVMGGAVDVPVVEFDDPGGSANFYKLSVRRDGWALPGFFTLNDNVRNGTHIIRPLRSNNFNIQPGDTLLVELQCVDTAVYDYFYVLEQAAGLGLSASPTPSNPAGNFDSGVLGCFSAHAVSVKKIVAE